MKNIETKKLGLTILGIVCVIGFVWYLRVTTKNGIETKNVESIVSPEQTKSVVSAQNSVSLSKEDKARLLAYLPQTATAEEREKYVDFVLSKSVETSKVDVSFCNASPLVAKIKNGTKLTFVSRDRESSHVISFDPKHVYTVPLNGSVEVTFNFSKYPGVKKYLCDSMPRGIVLLTN